MAENKIIEYSSSIEVGSINDSSTLYCRPLTPYSGYMLLIQGVTQQARTDNTVRPVKVMFNYVLRPNAYNIAINPNPAPVDLQMFLGWTKNEPGVLPSSADIGALYQFGSISTAPTGTSFDLINPINTDVWHIAKRWVHKVGFSSITGTGGTAALEYHANNDYKLNFIRKLNITKYCAKVFKFNDNGTLAYNKGLFFFCQAVPTLGFSYANTIAPAHLDYFVTFEFEDM